MATQEDFDAMQRAANRWQERAEKLHAALKIIALDPRISAWLAENDPKALAMACGVLGIEVPVALPAHAFKGLSRP